MSATDTLGNLLCVHVHAANIHDTKGGVFTFEKALYRYPTIIAARADQGIGEHLKTPLKSSITFGLAYLQEFKTHLKFNRFVGKLNGLFHGFRVLAAYQKIMR